MKRIFLAGLLALASSQGWAKAQDAAALEKQAEAAYDAKDYGTSATLYERAAQAGANTRSFYYNAACSHARAGLTDRAFAFLDLAVAQGQSNLAFVIHDSDLMVLHADPRWDAFIASIKRLHPEQTYLLLLADQSTSAFARYFPTRAAIDGGLPVPEKGTFREYYANLATFLGEYDEAGRYYATPSLADPVATGHVRAEPADARVVALAKGRDYVLLNESHAQAQTRAANFTLLAPLRAAGFTHLALEALTPPDPEPEGDAACAAAPLFDTTLYHRRYPVAETGFYLNEPVYGELLREALRLGFVPVSYDGGGNAGPREQHQARMIACIRERDPTARVVVIGGFGHISEQADETYPGGKMGYRLGQLTHSDPLTVDTVGMLSTDPATLQFPKADSGRGAQAYALLDAKGRSFARPGYDISLFVRAPAHRGDAAGSWLALDGARLATPIPLSACKDQRPCVLRARGEAEDAVATPEDSCVVHAKSDAPCTLYLRPGRHIVNAFDAQGTVLSEQTLEAGPH